MKWFPFCQQLLCSQYFEMLTCSTPCLREEGCVTTQSTAVLQTECYKLIKTLLYRTESEDRLGFKLWPRFARFFCAFAPELPKRKRSCPSSKMQNKDTFFRTKLRIYVRFSSSTIVWRNRVSKIKRKLVTLFLVTPLPVTLLRGLLTTERERF